MAAHTVRSGLDHSSVSAGHVSYRPSWRSMRGVDPLSMFTEVARRGVKRH